MKKLAIMSLALSWLVSCATQPPADPPAEEDIAEPVTLEDLIFPFYTLDYAQPGDEIPSPGNGTLLGYERDELGNYRAIVEVSISYYNFGLEKLTNISYVVGGLEEPVREPGPVNTSQTIGTAASAIYFTSRTDTLDPWAVRSTDTAAFTNGFWWFLPRWIEPTFTQFLSFRQIDSLFDLAEDYIELYAPLEDEGADFSFQYIDDRDRVRVPLPLDEYPGPVERTVAVTASEEQFYGGTGAIQFEQTVATINGYDVVLYWQRDFDRYLQNEYTLGEPLWIYCSLYAMDNINDKLVIFVRDFSVQPDEEIIAEDTARLLELKEGGYWEEQE